MMAKEFKRVPALDKGVRILELLDQEKKSMGISEIAKALGYHIGTVYNMVYTLTDLGILEIDAYKKFSLGQKICKLGDGIHRDPDLVQLLHPYLLEINKRTKLTTLLSIRSGLQSVVLDKIESSYDLRFSPEYGRRLSLFGGAVGKALLAQLSGEEFDDILSERKLKRYTSKTCVNKKKFKKMILEVRREGVAISNEERTEGVCAIAVPVPINRTSEPIAIWIVGLKNQINVKGFPFYKDCLRNTANRIRNPPV